MTEKSSTKRASRLYVVQTEAGKRLVRAKSLVAATQHVVRDLLVARVASPEDVAEIVSAGVRVEDADEQPAEPESEATPAAPAAPPWAKAA